MYMKNGVLVKGPPPKTLGTGPKVITHRAQKTIVAPSSRRLDALINGRARICVKRSLGGLGDIIMATPVSRGAKRKYPNCHVTYAVPADYAGGDLIALLENIPYIDEVIDYRLIDRDDFDAFTDITRVGLSDERSYTQPLNRIDLFAQACGVPLFGDSLPIYCMTEEEREWGKGFVEKHVSSSAPAGTIAIHLRSNDPKRTWPAHRVREFLSLARENGYHCFLFGWGDTADDWRIAGTTVAFDYKLRQAAAIMEHCDVLVCPDSCLLHLGGALNMRIVSLFGSMPLSCRINHYPNAIAVVNQQLSCIGCVYAGCTNNFYCMSSIFPQAVLAAVKQKLKDEFRIPGGPTDDPIHPGASKARHVKTFAI